MRLVVALTCFLAGCLAQRPHPCKSPSLLSGAITVSTQNEKLLVYVQYLYDAIGQRIRLWEQGSYDNKTFIADYLLHYRESAVYNINDFNHTCEKLPLEADFQPLGIPPGASLVGQAVLGSSSGPGEGLLINIWTGDLPEKAGKFLSTVTEFGCIPVSTLFHTDQYGWVVISFLNNIVGISDPSLLNPPNFCPQAEVDPQREPQDFLSLFLKTK
ncbi:ependymin-1-like isoform X2 [Betta splendens]|uniref:Ependymin-1-like isoform X2 n=1 Tax=Betta splendens TaxID=158456 RepID=A0A8M1HM29_BETSP|nr:ependymin-1-like isoform X2 [Betta splendens]